MSDKPRYTFTGDPAARPPMRYNSSPMQAVPYIASDRLKTAVNLAIFLQRPLLLEGEVGCGKTRLAEAIAYELGLPFYTWYVRSTSKVEDGFYTYDAIGRLYDAHTQHLEQARGATPGQPGGKHPKHRDPRTPQDYRELGPLGRAFLQRECPAVVLIDEIDKASLDFPNDLLNILGHPWKFTIPETGEVLAASEEHRPIVIITSNREKDNLPDAFLRRCVYFFIKFPESPEQLKQIIDVHHEGRDTQPSSELIQAAIQKFLEVRKGGLRKKPGTSEFLDWLKALKDAGKQPKPDEPVPFPELLFKVQADYERNERSS